MHANQLRQGQAVCITYEEKVHLSQPARLYTCARIVMNLVKNIMTKCLS